MILLPFSISNNFLSKLAKEICQGKTVVSASVMLDKPGQELGTRLSNQIYESCRAGELELQNFPNFEPTIAALKAGSARRECNEYKVCRQHGTKLVVLESLASKFLQTETLADRANDLIKARNEIYNADGDYMASDRFGFCLKTYFEVPQGFRNLEWVPFFFHIHLHPAFSS